MFYQKICPTGTSENVTLVGVSVFADITKLRISIGGHPGLRWARKPMMNVLKRERED